MTDSPAASPPPLDPVVPAATAGWHPLPARGALLHALGVGFAFALPAAFGVGLLASALLEVSRLPAGIVAGLAGLALGALVGRLRHRRIGWKLDADGFATRRGGLWRTETLVPVSRVQHLDLERGPLERRLGLATLVVHTAAVHLSGITVRGLDEADAQHLRDALARQLDDAGDAL